MGPSARSAGHGQHVCHTRLQATTNTQAGVMCAAAACAPAAWQPGKACFVVPHPPSAHAALTCVDTTSPPCPLCARRPLIFNSATKGSPPPQPPLCVCVCRPPLTCVGTTSASLTRGSRPCCCQLLPLPLLLAALSGRRPSRSLTCAAAADRARSSPVRLTSVPLRCSRWDLMDSRSACEGGWGGRGVGSGM